MEPLIAGVYLHEQRCKPQRCKPMNGKKAMEKVVADRDRVRTGAPESSRQTEGPSFQSLHRETLEGSYGSSGTRGLFGGGV